MKHVMWHLLVKRQERPAVAINVNGLALQRLSHLKREHVIYTITFEGIAFIQKFP